MQSSSGLVARIDTQLGAYRGYVIHPQRAPIRVSKAPTLNSRSREAVKDIPGACASIKKVDGEPRWEGKPDVRGKDPMNHAEIDGKEGKKGATGGSSSKTPGWIVSRKNKRTK